ncbi:hypothetical protein KI387_025280, partial [Taxus chinensis]
DILRRNLMSGVHTGCLSANANEELQVFVIFDTQEEIPDSPIVVGDLSCDIKASGLGLDMAMGLRRLGTDHYSRITVHYRAKQGFFP